MRSSFRVVRNQSACAVQPEVVGIPLHQMTVGRNSAASPNIARRVGWCEGVRREEPSDQERPSALAEWRNSRIVRGLE